MADFPSIAPPQYQSKYSLNLPQIVTPMEAGYRQTRKQFTRGRPRWTLYWNALPEADFQTLLAFFEANQGGAFTMPDPITGVSSAWQFETDELPGDPTPDSPGYRVVSLPIVGV